jgi:hypothetical protein
VPGSNPGNIGVFRPFAAGIGQGFATLLDKSARGQAADSARFLAAIALESGKNP